MPQILTFNGGLRKAVEAHLLRDNEALVYKNIDHIKGTLTPMKDKVLATPNAQKFGYRFKDTWFWSSVPTDFVEYQERLYISNRTSRPTKVIQGVTHLLGITPPTKVPTLVATSYAVGDLRHAKIFTYNDSGGDIPKDTDLEYRIINEDIDGNFAAGQKIITVTTGPWNGTYIANISIPSDSTWIYKAHVYRKYSGVWRLVGTLTLANPKPTLDDDTYDISGNASLDEGTLDPDIGVEGIIQYAYTYYNSTNGIESAPIVSSEIEVSNGTIVVSNIGVSTDPQVNKKRLYRIGGNVTAFTLVTTLDNATTTFTDDIHDLDLPGDLLTSQTNFPPPDTGLSYMTEAYGMFFAADGDKLKFTPIGQPDYWPETYYLDFPRDITGIAKTPTGILVFDKFKSWLVTGTGPLSLAQQPLSGSQGCVNGDSVANIEGGAFWASTDGICISNGGDVKVVTRDKLGKMYLEGTVNAAVYDDRYHLMFFDGDIVILDPSRDNIKVANYGVESLIVAIDRLYGYSGGRLHSLDYSPDSVLSFEYKSPKFIGRGYSVQKVYKNIYVMSRGDITVETYVNDELAQTDVFSTYDNHQIKLPTEYTRGFELQFRITGTGTVYEIRWEDGNANT